jgi:hypothetical protein
MSIDIDSARPRTERVRSGFRGHKRRQRWWRFGIAGLVAAVLIVGADLYFSPAHAYDRNAHQDVWLSAVQNLHGQNGCSSPSSAVTNLAAVGQVTLVCITRSGQKIESVIFWKTSGQEGTGLAYGSPPYDTCATPLGGLWWQIGPLDPKSMSCQRGFTYTTGP